MLNTPPIPHIKIHSSILPDQIFIEYVTIGGGGVNILLTSQFAKLLHSDQTNLSKNFSKIKQIYLSLSTRCRLKRLVVAIGIHT